MAESDGQKRILYLNSSNYANWKVTTKWMLVKDKTWDVVQNVKPQPVTEDWINKNNLAMSRLMLSVSEDQLIYIRHLDVASEVWSTLQQLYERKTMCSKVFLYRKYWTKRFSSGTMRQHITDMQELASQLRTAGIELSVPEEVAGLLASLPESYDGLITALESRDDSTLSMDFVSGKLLDEYARRFEHRTNGHDVDSAMFLTSSQKQKELQSEIRRSTRVTKGQPPVRYCYQAEERNHSDPASWDDMLKMSTREQQKWRLAAKAEMASLDKHKVFELANLPVGQHAITSKWVFKSKRDENGQVHIFKARLVARGFSQRYGVDYDETFAPVVKHDTVRVLLAYAAARGQHVRHLDVKSAYLNGELKEELYMEQPQGFVVKGAEDQVLRLRKSLYGLKQAARAWNKTATLTLKQEGFKQSQADPCLFTKADKNNSRIHVLLYVDDMLVVGDSAEVTQRVGKQLDKYFEMKDLGDVRHYLGIQVERVKDGSFNIHQSTKILALVAEYGLLDAKPVITPMETGFLSNDAPSPELPNNRQYRKAVGSLLYLANLSRPDIALAVGILCRRVQTPSESDWKAVKRVICYLHTTVDQKLHFQTGGKLELTGFVDADWAGDHHDRKSTSSFLFQMGASTITWSSRKQTTVALSSTEAEYVAVSHACRELQWLKRLLQDLGISIDYPIILHEDNQGCIKLVASDRCGNRTKHIDVSHHFIRDLWDNNVINLRYCPTEQMVPDILTKPLTKEKFLQLRLLIGLVKN